MLTGKYYITKRFFGGFNIFVQRTYMAGLDPYDEKIYTEYVKADISDIAELAILSGALVKPNDKLD